MSILVVILSPLETLLVSEVHLIAAGAHAFGIHWSVNVGTVKGNLPSLQVTLETHAFGKGLARLVRAIQGRARLVMRGRPRLYLFCLQKLVTGSWIGSFD